MGFQYVVPDTEIIGWANLQAWCMLTGLISKANYALRLIDDDEILHAVAQRIRDDGRIVCEPFRHIRTQPSASQVQCIG